MENHILQIEKELQTIKNKLYNNPDMLKDLDLKYDFILPYSNAKNISDIKLVIIGQDPTIQTKKESSSKRQSEITSTLDLENTNGNLRKYCKLICDTFGLDIDKEVYASNLCKCVFKEKPAYNGVLIKHSKLWLPLLKEELDVFPDNVIYITLGQPLIGQLVHSNSKKVNYYWDYVGKTTSGKNFKCNQPFENYLQKRIYPIAHQPTWKRNKFYNKYLLEYLSYIKRSETLIH